ncbi:hypothetical protein GUJ93_ZPchr0010g8486 [Zizania palustris]|uniref:Uncharacterized protein n=1 Tax=Zizania palustris TaxID=103762 RepID=A0A8J5W824_ZIZPA|nr:hypothetical protein GUJ93_ZPchr0010g8486 [Zizania palustris]
MEGRALALSQFCVRVVGSPFLLSVDSGGARGCSGASGRGRVARITPEAYPSSAGRGRAWKRDSPEASPRRAVAAVRLLRIEKGKAFVDLLNEKGNGSGENEMSYVEMKSGAPGATADTTLPESSLCEYCFFCAIIFLQSCKNCARHGRGRGHGADGADDGAGVATARTAWAQATARARRSQGGGRSRAEAATERSQGGGRGGDAADLGRRPWRPPRRRGWSARGGGAGAGAAGAEAVAAGLVGQGRWGGGVVAVVGGGGAGRRAEAAGPAAGEAGARWLGERAPVGGKR